MAAAIRLVQWDTFVARSIFILLVILGWISSNRAPLLAWMIAGVLTLAFIFVIRLEKPLNISDRLGGIVVVSWMGIMTLVILWPLLFAR